MRFLTILSLLLATKVSTLQYQTVKYGFTGLLQSFSIPDHVSVLDVEIVGASGGSDLCHGIWIGGVGHFLAAKIVIPETLRTLFINVGGAGESRDIERCYNSAVCEGGYNGGGNSSLHSGAGGGGSSDIRIHPLDLSSRIIVAGAGGGGSAFCHYNGNNEIMLKGVLILTFVRSKWCWFASLQR